MNQQSMTRITKVVERQLGTAALVSGDFDPDTLIRFSPHLPSQLSPTRRGELLERASQLAPWLQGPFFIGDDLVVGGAWRNDSRWVNLAPEVPYDLRGNRVLDIGSNAGYDPFMFNLREPDYVLACEPFAFIEQARFLESIYQTGVDFQPMGWQELDLENHGTFDLVHCHGVLYHECDPVGLLNCLYEMTAPGGLLLFGSMMHANLELADTARFVPRSYYGDETWWWVPGPLALRAMLESVGFKVEKTFGDAPGPPGEFPTTNGYFRATRPS